ncbi:MAG: NFACT RNA binding domain-containing protein [Desulfohalobiaceae bacterium]|nr:NFACT RNA binding domain-containing protein [Desulfohalobiaceae bacterium]
MASSKPDNPQTPSTRAQWLRKRLQNRKISSYRIGWPERKAAFRLSPGPGNWLLIDLQQGLDLVDDLDADFDQEPVWPQLEEILSRERIYREHPQLTPPLRKTLKALPSSDARTLLSKLQDNAADTFSVSWNKGQVCRVLPWSIADTQIEEVEKTESFSEALKAAERYGWSLFQEKIDPGPALALRRKQAITKIEKNLKRLEMDEARLVQFCAEGEQAEVLQTHLYELDHNAKMQQVTVETPDCGLRRIALNPELTLLENMERMFKRSRKGRRGLKHIRKRRQDLQEERRALENEEFVPEERAKSGQRTKKASEVRFSERWKGISLHVFRSSQGFVILRGKNQKSNHRLLTEVAKPFDYWFHAQDGPGAHVILQRAHKGQEVPRQSLLEAAVVAGAAGYQARAEKAGVMCALVKDVRTVKGASAGKVRVERIEESLLVDLHKGLDRGLKKIA